MSKPGNTVSLTGKGWVPRGYIYFQFPGESEPGTLFSGTWSNVSSQTAAKFFRAEGGNADSFGITQNPTNKSHNHAATNSSNGAAPNHTHNINLSTTGFHRHGLWDCYCDNSAQCDSTDQQRVSNWGYGTITRTLSLSGDHSHLLSVEGVGFQADLHNHSSSIVSSGIADGRPDNDTIRIWERTL